MIGFLWIIILYFVKRFYPHFSKIIWQNIFFGQLQMVKYSAICLYRLSFGGEIYVEKYFIKENAIFYTSWHIYHVIREHKEILFSSIKILILFNIYFKMKQFQVKRLRKAKRYILSCYQCNQFSQFDVELLQLWDFTLMFQAFAHRHDDI